MYEESNAGCQFFVRIPQIYLGSRNRNRLPLSNNTDFAPTLIEMAVVKDPRYYAKVIMFLKLFW